MPSWNIHTALVERLLVSSRPEELGIKDANAFLFGNYAPDINLGFMVPDVSFRIDYCLTHLADVNSIPVPKADKFWDYYIYRRRPRTDTGMSLIVGAWAHVLADSVYNTRFRAFVADRGLAIDDALRRRKQGDFALFGNKLSISSLVEVTPELVRAAHEFRPYSIPRVDVERAAEVANDIVLAGVQTSEVPAYELLDDRWMTETFELCVGQMRAVLTAWQEGERRGERVSSVDLPMTDWLR